MSRDSFTKLDRATWLRFSQRDFISDSHFVDDDYKPLPVPGARQFSGQLHCSYCNCLALVISTDGLCPKCREILPGQESCQLAGKTDVSQLAQQVERPEVSNTGLLCQIGSTEI